MPLYIYVYICMDVCQYFQYNQYSLPTMHKQQQSQIYTLLSLQPCSMILQHNTTRKLYRYCQSGVDIKQLPVHEIILLAQPLCSGFIYQKQVTTLAKHLQPKLHSIVNKQYFEESQLNNTFQGVLDYLQKGYQYQNICLQNVLIDTNGDIKLKDPRLVVSNSRVSDDGVNVNINASVNASDGEKLGLMMMQCALLKNYQEVCTIERNKKNLVMLLGKYSSKFISNMWILLNNVQHLIAEISFSDAEVKCAEQLQIIEEINKIKKEIPKPERKQIVPTAPQSQRRIIVIPPLNFKFNRTKKPERKAEHSRKSSTPNQNENEEEKTCIPKQAIQRIFNTKTQSTKSNNNSINNVNEQKHSKQLHKKLQMVENYEISGLRKKGKTVDKREKMTQHSN